MLHPQLYFLISTHYQLFSTLRINNLNATSITIFNNLNALSNDSTLWINNLSTNSMLYINIELFSIKSDNLVWVVGNQTGSGFIYPLPAPGWRAYYLWSILLLIITWPVIT